MKKMTKKYADGGGTKGSARIERLQKREDKLVYRGNKAVDEGREKKADRLLGRAAKLEDRKIRLSEKKKMGGSIKSKKK
jgi:phage shock protein A